MVIWQDVVLMAGGIGFGVALIPSVRNRIAIPKMTCLMTGGILAAFCVVYATLGLWLACVSTLVTSILWFVLYKRRSK